MTINLKFKIFSVKYWDNFSRKFSGFFWLRNVFMFSKCFQFLRWDYKRSKSNLLIRIKFGLRLGLEFGLGCEDRKNSRIFVYFYYERFSYLLFSLINVKKYLINLLGMLPPNWIIIVNNRAKRFIARCVTIMIVTS